MIRSTIEFFTNVFGNVIDMVGLPIFILLVVASVFFGVVEPIITSKEQEDGQQGRSRRS